MRGKSVMWPLRFISLYLITLSTTNRSQEVLTWKYFKLEIANDIPKFTLELILKLTALC